MSLSTLTAQSIAVAAERGGAAVAVTGGAWAWLAENHQAIGAACAIVGATAAVLGFFVHTYIALRKP